MFNLLVQNIYDIIADLYIEFEYLSFDTMFIIFGPVIIFLWILQVRPKIWKSQTRELTEIDFD
jgi:hypothetical protein